MSHDSSPDASAIDRLLGERAWVARLAHSLVSDPGSADDLAQETWLSVVEAPPHEVEKPRAWLATVLRRRIATWRRAAGRRSRHESSAARSEATPSTDELAARTEVTERLARAVLALDEPYRTTVLHRYVDGAPPRDVARRMGVPVETVRTRTRRAIELLRADLDPKDPDRRRRFAVAVFALGDGDRALVGDGATLSFATLAMSGVGVVAVVGIVSLAAGWWSEPRRRAETADARVEAPTDASNLAAHPSPTPISSVAGGSPRVVESSAARWSMEGTVVEEATGRGIPGATVRLTLSLGARPDLLAVLRSDESGRFTTDLPALDALSRAGRAAARLDASVRVPGYTRRGMVPSIVTAELRKPPHRMTVTIPLVAGFDARGRVVDARGRPVPSAQVAVYCDGVESLGSGTSDEDGRYEVFITRPGPGFVMASASPLGTAALEGVTWPAGSDFDVPDLVLTGAGSIAGSVRSTTGAPMPGIVVLATSLDVVEGGAREHLRVARGTDWSETRTDRFGRFELTGLRPGRWGVSALRSPVKGAPDTIETTTDGRDVALIVPGHLVRVRLVDEAGVAILGVGIDATCVDAPGSARLWSGSDDAGPGFAFPGGCRVVYSTEQPGFVPIHEVVVAGADGSESTVTLTLKEQRDVGSIVLVPRCSPAATVTSAGLRLVNEATGREVPIADTFAFEPMWSPTDDPIVVPPGRYRLTFSPRGPGEDESGSMFLPTTIAVAVETGAVTRVEIPCRRGGRVRFALEETPKEGLSVDGGDALPASGGDAIELTPWVQETDDGLSWGSPGLHARPGRPIWSGRALEPGAYRIRLRIKGYTATDVSVVVEEGRFTDATVRVSAR